MRSVTQRAKLCPGACRPRRTERIQRTVLTLGLALLAQTATPQTTDDTEKARLHFGPLGLTPTVSIANFGYESNVFNDPVRPKSDFTATLTPGLQLWLRMGRARLSADTRVDARLFKQYHDENALNVVNGARFELLLNRIRPYAAASFMHVTERPDVEIDERVERRERSATLGVVAQLAPRTFVRVFGERADVSFAENERFRGTSLRRELNRTLEVKGAAFEYDLTPVTRLVLDVQREDTQFPFEPKRNAHGLRIVPGLSFRPRALISGFARFGFFQYTPSDADVAPFSGPIASVDVRSILRGFEITGDADRSLYYSVDSQVYFIQTQVGGAVTRQLNDRWFAGGNISRQWIAYPPSAGAIATAIRPAPSLTVPPAPGSLVEPVFVSSRPERVSVVGVGAGYRISRETRAAFGASYSHRDAALPSGRYDNLRILGTVTYGAR